MIKQHAFTLMEALVTLTIISIITMMTIPAMHELLTQAQDNKALNQMRDLIEIARNESALRQKTVTLCQSQNLHACNGTWSQGQIIFVDNDRDGIVHERTQIIAVNKMQAEHGSMYVRFYPYYRSYIQFHPLQQEDNDNGTIWYCHQHAQRPAWVIMINKMGASHVLLPDQNGEINDKENGIFKC